MRTRKNEVALAIRLAEGALTIAHNLLLEEREQRGLSKGEQRDLEDILNAVRIAEYQIGLAIRIANGEE